MMDVVINRVYRKKILFVNNGRRGMSGSHDSAGYGIDQIIERR
jgi:hypothetical protein